MRENIFSSSKKIKEVFKDERYLYPEFVPERLPHRDAEIDALVFSFNPVLQGKKPQNVFVFGNSGTGKTVTVKYVLKELEEFSDRAKAIYVNCFEFNTRHAILSQLTNFLGTPVPRRGIATDEVYVCLLDKLKKIDFIPIVVLDEVDQLLREGEASKVLYDLLRVIEHEALRFGLIFISNNEYFLSKLDARVKSSLAVEKLEFKQYNVQQLKDILTERAEFAFFSNSLEKEVIPLIAAHAAKLNGDARIAIECLWKSGKQAERENSDKVRVEHVKKVFDLVDELPLKKVIDSLNEQEKLVLKVISDAKPKNSGKVFKEYKEHKDAKLSLRSFRDIILKLEKLGLINAPLVEKNMRGRTKKISLKVSKESVLKYLH